MCVIKGTCNTLTAWSHLHMEHIFDILSKFHDQRVEFFNTTEKTVADCTFASLNSNQNYCVEYHLIS